MDVSLVMKLESLDLELCSGSYDMFFAKCRFWKYCCVMIGLFDLRIDLFLLARLEYRNDFVGRDGFMGLLARFY